MKIQFLGTAAAEGVPCLFCLCAVCENARAVGGREIRTRSQALIDGSLLIDLPPDTYLHALRFGLRPENLTHLLLTHSHADHLYVSELRNRRRWYAHFDEDAFPPLHIYAGESGVRAVEELLAEQGEPLRSRVTASRVTSLVPFPAGGYTVTPYPASHARHTSPFLYGIEKDGKSILYAHDTGYLLPETWAALEKRNEPFDLVSLDCTCTASDACRDHHLGLSAALEVFARLEEIGAVDAQTVRVLHHFSHNGGYSYADLQAKVAPLGYIVSYDGLTIEF